MRPVSVPAWWYGNLTHRHRTRGSRARAQRYRVLADDLSPRQTRDTSLQALRSAYPRPGAPRHGARDTRARAPEPGGGGLLRRARLTPAPRTAGAPDRRLPDRL